MHSQKEVNLLITPLAMYYEHNLGNFDLAAYLNTLHRTPFRRLQHWAVQAGNTVYEVTRRGADGGIPTFRYIPSSQWWEEAEKRKATVQKRFLGVTQDTKSRLIDLAKFIWSGVMKQEYQFATSNCQTFAMIFRQLIVNNDDISWELRAQIRHAPIPLNPFIALGEKVRLVRKLAQQHDTGIKWLQIHRTRASKSPQSPLAMIPRRPSSRWLDTLKHETKVKGINSDRDFYAVVRRVNEKMRPKQKTLWQRFLCAIGMEK